MKSTAYWKVTLIMYWVQNRLYLCDAFADRAQIFTQSAERCLECFYHKRSILMNMRFRPVFQDPVTYIDFFV